MKIEYFAESSCKDLDLTGLSKEACNFVAKKFERIRSQKVIESSVSHRINICLLGKNFSSIEEILKPELEKYEYFCKINCSASYVMFQSNKKFRYLVASNLNFLLLETTFEILMKNNVFDK